MLLQLLKFFCVVWVSVHLGKLEGRSFFSPLWSDFVLNRVNFSCQFALLGYMFCFLSRELRLPEALGEQEALADFQKIMSKNKVFRELMPTNHEKTTSS